MRSSLRIAALVAAFMLAFAIVWAISAGKPRLTSVTTAAFFLLIIFLMETR